MVTIYLSDLDELQDITSELVFEDEPNIFTEDHAIEIVETALHLMEEFMIENPTVISEPNFHDILLEEIKEMFYVQMEDHILDSEYIQDDMDDLLEDAFNIYITTFHPERSIQVKEDDDDDDMESNIPEIYEPPSQRTVFSTAIFPLKFTEHWPFYFAPTWRMC